MKIKRIILILICFFGLQYSFAQNLTNNYQNKTINLIVGSSPGGGYDRMARFLAPYIEEKTSSTVVVRNISSAGGLTSINQFISKKSNLDLIYINTQAAFLAQILSLPNVNYDLKNISYVGKVSSDPYVVLVNPNSSYKTFDDLINSKSLIKWASSGITTGSSTNAAILSEVFNLNSKIIMGYKGSNETALSTMRGETDAIIVTAPSALKYINNQNLIPLAVLDEKRYIELPNIPTIFELVKLNENQKWWIDFRLNLSKLGKSLAVSSINSQENIQFLSSVVEEILSTPNISDKANSQGLNIDFEKASNYQNFVVDFFESIEKEKLPEIKYILLEKYY